MKPLVSRTDVHTDDALRAIEHYYAADGFSKAAIRELLAAHACRSMADLHRIGKVPGLLPEGAGGNRLNEVAERDDILVGAAGGAAGGYSAVCAGWAGRQHSLAVTRAVRERTA
ncbi:MAG: hypothetical protein AABZ70_01865 [candidate division NC10 bacterium]